MFFHSELSSITRRRQHYMRERTTVPASRFSGIDREKIRQKIQATPPSRRQIESVLFFDTPEDK